MGMTTIPSKIFNAADLSHSAEVEFVVDSGAVYSVVPRTVLESLGIEVQHRRRFYTADGRPMDRDMAFAVFEYNGERTATTVIVGEEGDSSLMGVVTLEEFGFTFDPIRRELRPIVMRI